MKNAKQKGEVIEVVAPAGGIASGSVVIKGGFVGVAVIDAAEGETCTVIREGVFELPKATGAAWTQGDSIYWDNTAKNCTKTSSGNTLLGYAFNDAASGDALGNVSLKCV